MTQIFVNLPVRDLPRSVAFYTQLGYAFDPRFTDEKGTCSHTTSRPGRSTALTQ